MSGLTVGAHEAASILRLSVDCLLRKARAGIIPGARIGREWVFIREDLIGLIRTRARELACHSIAEVVVPSGGAESSSAASRLDARLAQIRKQPPKSSRRGSAPSSGASTTSESYRAIPGTPLSRGGTERPPDEDVTESWRGFGGSRPIYREPLSPQSLSKTSTSCEK